MGDISRHKERIPFPRKTEKSPTALVIGAGLGGLLTGAILAWHGWKVTILEKNAIIGGGLQSFRRLGMTFDSGMHVVGGMQDGGSVRRLLDYLGVLDETLFDDTDPGLSEKVYVQEDGTSYEIKSGKEGFVESLSRYFPNERENLRCYVEAMEQLTQELPLFHLRPSSEAGLLHSEKFFMAADGFIRMHIKDRRLQGVLAHITMLYSGRAGVTPAFIHAVLSMLCISGTSRFMGGSIRLAKQLKALIEELGGKVLTNEKVRSIHTRDQKVTGLTTCQGRQFTADQYISDIHPGALLSLFEDPSALPKAFRTRVQSIPETYSAFTLNIRFKKDAFPLLGHTAYYLRSYDRAWDLDTMDEDWPHGFLYMTPPDADQDLDQEVYARKMIVTVPMAWDAVKPWEGSMRGHRPSDYAAWKQCCKEKVLDRLEKIHPGFRKAVDAVNTASPLTIRDFYGTLHGGMSGYEKDCRNMTLSRLDVRTKIPNLLLTGQYVHLHGFCGVPLTAILTSEAILGENAVINMINRDLSDMDLDLPF